MKKLLSIHAPVTIFFLLLLPMTSFARDTGFTNEQALIAMGLCTEMDQRINVIIDYSETKCIPSLAAKGTNFIFVTEKPIFLVEASKKAWLIVVVAAVGKALNDNPSYVADQVLVADMTMATSLKYYSLPAILTKRLQRDIYTGKISPEEMWAQISGTLKPYVLPK